MVEDLISGEVKMADKSHQKEMSEVVQRANETKMKAQMVQNLQQLRLRAPDMVKKEYYGLLEKVKEQDDEQFESTKNASSTRRKTKEVFSSAFKAKNGASAHPDLGSFLPDRVPINQEDLNINQSQVVLPTGEKRLQRKQ